MRTMLVFRLEPFSLDYDLLSVFPKVRQIEWVLKLWSAHLSVHRPPFFALPFDGTWLSVAMFRTKSPSILKTKFEEEFHKLQYQIT